MSLYAPLGGVYAAAVTPLRPDFSPDLDALQDLIRFLARRGCHGALLLGTTGEGPSFAHQERQAIFRAAREAADTLSGFRLLAGTGTPSLEETISLTGMAFDLGMDGVVVLPPYYYRSASEEGLFAWFCEVLRRATPEGGALLGYHIPTVSGVPISIDLVARLADAFPTRFAGIKDSSADGGHARRIGERFGEDLLVLNGTDRFFSLALKARASGCITALANLLSPQLRRIWDAHRSGGSDDQAQTLLSAARNVMDCYPPAPPLLKALLARRYGFPLWAVRPPLLPAPVSIVDIAESELFSDR